MILYYKIVLFFWGQGFVAEKTGSKWYSLISDN